MPAARDGGLRMGEEEDVAQQLAADSSVLTGLNRVHEDGEGSEAVAQQLAADSSVLTGLTRVRASSTKLWSQVLEVLASCFMETANIGVRSQAKRAMATWRSRLEGDYRDQKPNRLSQSASSMPSQT